MSFDQQFGKFDAVNYYLVQFYSLTSSASRFYCGLAGRQNEGKCVTFSSHCRFYFTLCLRQK